MKKANSKTAKAKKKNMAFNPPVIKSFFAVIPKDYDINQMATVILSDTEAHAIFNFEAWNNNDTKYEEVKKNWKIVRVEAKNV